MLDRKERSLGHFDVAVCGGGIAGASAAISAARAGAHVVLVERSGCLGGTLTDGCMPQILDRDGKGGIVRELYDFLDAHSLSLARRGARTDADGRPIPGQIVDTEACKYFFDRTCEDAGITVLFHSLLAAVDVTDGRIARLLLATECGGYMLSADVYIDATGGGALAAQAGCAFSCGEPHTGRPSPASLSVYTVGMPSDYDGTDSVADKDAYAAMLAEYGITTSAEQVTVKRLPALGMWNMGFNFEYDVYPDDILSLSRAEMHARREIFEVIEAQRAVPGFEHAHIACTGAHIGLREGRRIEGEYRLTDADILEGRRFDDAVCLVTAGVDVHKLHPHDTTECSRGVRSMPYHIPYRALVARDVHNLLLAGRCLSGDFYPHASYRMMGNMAATGEAAGFAAAQCASEGCLPRTLNGTRVRDFMESRGYKL